MIEWARASPDVRRGERWRRRIEVVEVRHNYICTYIGQARRRQQGEDIITLYGKT